MYLLISCTEKGTGLLRWYSCQKFLPNFNLFMKRKIRQIHIESFYCYLTVWCSLGLEFFIWKISIFKNVKVVKDKDRLRIVTAETKETRQLNVLWDQSVEGILVNFR